MHLALSSQRRANTLVDHRSLLRDVAVYYAHAPTAGQGCCLQLFCFADHTPRGCSAAKAVDEIRAQLPEFRTELPGLRVLHLDPLVLTFDDFFTEDMCDEYVAKALTGEASQLASPTFSQATAAARTSTTWFLRYAEAAELVGRACALTGAALQRWEEPQLVRYRPGE
eukprot:3346434-Pleurochrysis_carterae.AAC.2